MEAEIAYLAGLIDGEAYVGIKKTRRADARSPIYNERIQIRMTSEDAIRALAATLGGNYYLERRPQVEGRRRLYCYQATNASASAILRCVLPYLRVKRRVAETVLALTESKRDPVARRHGGPTGRVMAPEILAERERLYLRCKALNQGEEVA